MDEPLPNPPPELKAVLPFVQRANELRAADKVIAYWCCYYAAQLGISATTSSTEAKMYLLTLMDTLELLKSKLADNDAVVNDAASSAYVENFALKVFVGADNEDRAGRATRATPRKFLAASQFLELLKIFGSLEPEMGEKIKYAKWKAADIAKAFKEGRVPLAGPAGGDAKMEEAKIADAMGPGTVDSKEEQEYLAREMAKLTVAPSVSPADGMTRGSSSTSAHQALQLPSKAAVDADQLDSASLDGEEMWKTDGKPTVETLSRSPSAHAQLPPSTSFTGSSPGRPLPTPPQRDAGLDIPSSAHDMLSSSPSFEGQGGPGAAPASFWGASGPTDESTTTLPSVPTDHWAAPSHGTSLPSVPADALDTADRSGLDGHPAIERIPPPRSPTAPSLPTTPGQLPGKPPAHASGPSMPSAPPTIPASAFSSTSQPPFSASQAPTAFPPARTAPAPSAPVIAPTYPETLDAKLSSRVQKLAKGAASAVDFEDLDTARIQLRQALDILEGRTTK